MLKNSSAGGPPAMHGRRKVPPCGKQDSPEGSGLWPGPILERGDNHPPPGGAAPPLDSSPHRPAPSAPGKPASVPARVYKMLWELSEELRASRGLADCIAVFLPGMAAIINAGSAAFCLYDKSPGGAPVPGNGFGWNLCGPSGELSLVCKEFFLQDSSFTHFMGFNESGGGGGGRRWRHNRQDHETTVQGFGILLRIPPPHAPEWSRKPVRE